MLLDRDNGYIGHFIVSLVALCIFLVNISHSGVWFPFMSSHALNGIFYKDMIEGMGFFHPRDFAERYYAQYPSLTVGIYPPFFYLVEALLFKIFGISLTVAKLTVFLFTLAGANALLLLSRLWFPLWLCVAGSILYLLQPSTLFGQKNVMLEMPFLSVSMIALYYLYTATQTVNSRASFLAPLFSAIAFLTRQSAVFLLPIWFIWITLGRKWKVIKSVPFILGSVFGTIILTPWIIINLTTGRGHLGHLNFQSANIWPGSVFYFRHFSEIASYPVIVLSALSLILLPKLTSRDSYKFALVWAGAVILFLLPVKLAEPRYAIGLIPPLIILSLQVIWFLREKVPSFFRRRNVYIGLMVVLICLHLDSRAVWDSPDIRGFDQAADFVARDPNCVSVLYDGYFNSNFILHMRMRDKDRRVLVFRASKVVFSTRFHIEMGYHDLVKEPSEFYDLLNRYSIKYIIQEEKDWINTPANRRLRKWMQGSKFELVRQFPISTSRFKECGSLLVYEYLDYEEKPVTRVELDMPSMGRKIMVTFEDNKNH